MDRPGNLISLADELLHWRANRDTARELRVGATNARSRSQELHRQTQELAYRCTIGSLAGRPDGDLAPAAPPTAPSDEVTRLTAQLDQVRAEAAHLRAALASRDVIWEAKLIIAAATGCDAPEAQQLLVRQSQHENRKLRDIAEEIVRRGHA